MTGANIKVPKIKTINNSLHLLFARPFNQIKSLSDNEVKETNAFAVTDNLDDININSDLINNKYIELNSKKKK